MDTRVAVLEQENKNLRELVVTLRERLVKLEEAAQKPVPAKKGPGGTAAIARKEVNWSMIPKGNALFFSVENKTNVVAKEDATFMDAKTIVPKDKNLLPTGKTSFASINAWATACLKKHLAALGRQTASVNVYDKNSGISYKNAAGAFVPLNTIQTIVRATAAAPAPAPAAPNPAAVGGAAQPAESMEQESQPASQDSQQGEDCWRCQNFVADGQECECDKISCLCSLIVEEEEYRR